MTIKLIQELVGLAVEKEVCIEYLPQTGVIMFCKHGFVELCEKDAPAQLQAAIDKIKEL